MGSSPTRPTRKINDKDFYTYKTWSCYPSTCGITKRYLIRDIPRTLLEVHIVDFQVEGCINQLIIDKNYLPIDDKND